MTPVTRWPQCNGSVLTRERTARGLASRDQLFPIGLADAAYITPMSYPHRFASTTDELQFSTWTYLDVEKSAVIWTLGRT